jgi:hypothetical protein
VPFPALIRVAPPDPSDLRVGAELEEAFRAAGAAGS